MSKLCDRRDLREIISSGHGTFVLFYAAWCPFSRVFLPIFEKYAKGREKEFVRVSMDGNEELFEEHAIEVYPTVLFFTGGALAKRLDGKHLAGLREKQFVEFIDSCGSGGE